MLAALGLSLTACAGSRTKLLTMTGACDAFGAGPKYEIKGATRYDQDWIDDKVEAGIGGCEWERPAPRPQSLDVKVQLDRPAKVVVAPPAKPKKKRLFDRWRKKAPDA